MQAWLNAQNDYARTVLAGLPGRGQLLARIRELNQSAPQVRATRLPGDRYLIWKLLPGEVTKLYLRKALTGGDGTNWRISAYHHVKDRTPYPAVLLTTGINEPRSRSADVSEDGCAAAGSDDQR